MTLRHTKDRSKTGDVSPALAARAGLALRYAVRSAQDPGPTSIDAQRARMAPTRQTVFAGAAASGAQGNQPR